MIVGLLTCPDKAGQGSDALSALILVQAPLVRLPRIALHALCVLGITMPHKRNVFNIKDKTLL